MAHLLMIVACVVCFALLPFGISADCDSSCHQDKSWVASVCASNGCGDIMPCLDQYGWKCNSSEEPYDCDANCWGDKDFAERYCGRKQCGGVKACDKGSGWMCDATSPAVCLLDCHSHDYAQDICAYIGCDAQKCSPSTDLYTCVTPSPTPSPTPSRTPSSSPTPSASAYCPCSFRIDYADRKPVCTCCGVEYVGFAPSLLSASTSVMRCIENKIAQDTARYSLDPNHSLGCKSSTRYPNTDLIEAMIATC